MIILQNQTDFLSFIEDQRMPNGNLSIRGVARCCDVDDRALIKGAEFKSQKLGQKLMEQGFTAADLVKNGFPPQAVWICVEYFAFESKAKAPMAKQLARTFGSIGIMATLEELKPKPTLSLEALLLPKASIKEIEQAYDLYKKAYGELYAYRYLQQQMQKHLPQLAGDEPEPLERPSLPSAEAWLTPTQIAAQLNWMYKTGSPNPQAVNKQLETLGYQTKVDGSWHPTLKALSANLVDRKPVATTSKTQKDQLFWAASIVDILQEWTISC
jgi:hypothetical protein